MATVKDQLSMARELTRKERLEALLANENSKTIPRSQLVKSRTPARSRELVADTVKTTYSHVTKEDLAKADIRAAQAEQRNMKYHTGPTKASKTASSTHNPFLSQQSGMNFSSVYQGGSDQSHVTMLASQHRRAKAESEWTLLATFEKTLADADRAQRKIKEKERVAAQRAALNTQLEEKRRMQEIADQAKAAERIRIQEQIAAYKADEQRAREKQREKDEIVRQQREQQLREIKDHRDREAEKRRRRDLEEVQRIQEAMEQDRLAAEERKRLANLAFQETMRQNDAIQREKDEKAKRQAAADEEMMRQYIKRLEKEEAERAQKMEDFKKSIQEKAARVGDILVKDAEEKDRKENELLAKLERKKERDEKRKEKEEKRRVKKMQQEVNYTVEQQKALKRQIQEEKKRQEMQYGAQVLVEAEKARNEEMERKIATRMRNIENRKVIEQQMYEREMRDTVAGVYMTNGERRFNNEILEQAVKLHPDMPASQLLATHHYATNTAAPAEA